MGESSEIEVADGAANTALLRRANRALRLLSRCNGAIVRSADETALLNELCHIAVDSAGYRLAWVGRAESDPNRSVSLVTYAGPGEFLNAIRVSWDDNPFGQGVVGFAIRERRASTIRDLQNDFRFAAWRADTALLGVHSAIAVPLFIGADVFGALAVYATEPDAFDATEIELLADLGSNISYGMGTLRAQKQRDETERSATKILERFRRAQTIGQIGSWELNVSGGAIWASEEAFKLYGLPMPADQMIAYDQIRDIPLPEYRHVLDKSLSDLVAGRRAYDVEYTIRRPSDGAIRYIHSCADLTQGPDGRPASVLGTIHDVTNRKHLEQQLLHAQKLESVGLLAGGIAHDFNNLLTVIDSCAAMLLSQVGRDHPFRSDIEEIQKASVRAAALTRQLLAFSRKQVMEPKVFDMNEVVGNAERMLRRAMGNVIELVTHLWPDPVRLFADPGAVEQVILNIALNARDAMKRGGTLRIETQSVVLGAGHRSLQPEMSPGRYVMIAMTDTGEGMNAALQSRIFEPFFTTKKDLGTGLGLSTVYGIVRQSGGAVLVESEPGRGSTFTVYLPQVSEDL